MQQQWSPNFVSAGISILWLLCSGVLTFSVVNQSPPPSLNASIVLAVSLLILSGSLSSLVAICLANSKVEIASSNSAGSFSENHLHWISITVLGLATGISVATLLEMTERGLLHFVSWSIFACIELSAVGFLVWQQFDKSKTRFASSPVLQTAASISPKGTPEASTGQSNSIHSDEKHTTASSTAISAELEELRSSKQTNSNPHTQMEDLVTTDPGQHDSNLLKAHRGASEPVILGSDEEFGVQLSEGTRQQIVDRLDDQGFRQILGLTRCTIAPGQHAAIIQLAFSPPFELAPELETMADLDNIQIKVANLLPNGARLEVKRPASASACDVIVEWIAQEAA